MPPPRKKSKPSADIFKKAKQSAKDAATGGGDDDAAPTDARSKAQAAVPIGERRNAAFEAYYGEQLFPEDPEGLRAFANAMTAPTPMTLRLHQTQPPSVRRRAAEQLRAFGGGVRPVLWAQELLPWRHDAGGGEVKGEEDMVWECSHDEYHARPAFEAWCRSAHRGGRVNFQESVSLLPALLAALAPHHAVADLCAAPGSKTTQALDIMHRAAEAARQREGGGGTEPPWPSFPSGFVVANEADGDRARLYLAGRLRHLTTPCAAVTIGPAQSLPVGGHGGGLARAFDRVLCDVPCSGDGTLRKDPTGWRRWSPRDGLELHGLQVKTWSGPCTRHDGLFSALRGSESSLIFALDRSHLCFPR